MVKIRGGFRNGPFSKIRDKLGHRIFVSRIVSRIDINYQVHRRIGTMKIKCKMSFNINIDTNMHH